MHCRTSTIYHNTGSRRGNGFSRLQDCLGGNYDDGRNCLLSTETPYAANRCDASNGSRLSSDGCRDSVGRGPLYSRV